MRCQMWASSLCPELHVGCCCLLRTTACKGLYETEDEVPREEGRGPSAQELSLHLTLTHAHAYTYMCTRESTCTHTYTTHTHSHMQTRVCTQVHSSHTRTDAHSHTYTLTVAHTHLHTCVHMHTPMWRCLLCSQKQQPVQSHAPPPCPSAPRRSSALAMQTLSK